jgi:hypothetical protein
VFAFGATVPAKERVGPESIEPALRELFRCERVADMIHAELSRRDIALREKRERQDF